MTALLRLESRKALSAASAAQHEGRLSDSWALLERAHILSQPVLVDHLRVHVAMLGFAIRQRNAREVTGQALRLILAPLGHLTGRIPWGNGGRSTVSPFAAAPLPEDIAALYAAAGVKIGAGGAQ